MATRKCLFLGISALTVLGAITLDANADIIQEQTNQNILWPSGSTRGQTFLADASVATITSIEFYYSSSNTSLPAAQPTILIYEGEGFGGNVVDSSISPLIPSDSVDSWIEVQFTNAEVTPGQMYTFQLNQATGAAGGYAIWGDASVDVYPNGEHLTNDGSKLTHAFFDNMFRIHGVPEPSTLGLALLVAVGPAFTTCRKFKRRPQASGGDDHS